MSIGKSYYKLRPTTDYAGSYTLWTPSPGIADALNAAGAEYNSSAYGGETASASYPLKPTVMLGGTLYGFTIHFQYEMSRTSGAHLFELDGRLYSVQHSTNTPKITIYGSESASGTVDDKTTTNEWDYIFPTFMESSRFMGPRCSQGTQAYGCYAKVLDYYVLIEFRSNAAIVTTQDATNIAATSVTGNGRIMSVPEGNFTTRGFEYYKDGLPDDITTESENGDFSTGTFSLPFTGLTQDQLYYYRTFALNDELTTYGDWVEFTPEEFLEPVVTTQAASVPVAVPNPAYYEWATGNGTIVSGEKITDRGFEIVVNFSGDLYDSIQHSIAGFEGTASWDNTAWAYVGTLTKTETEDIGFGGYFEAGAYDMELGSFPSTFSDMLFAGETYTYRAFATNDIGTGYGDYVEFTIDTWTSEDGDDSVNDDLSDGDPCVPIIPIDPGIGDIGDIGDTIPDFDFPPFDPFEDSPYPDWDFDYPPWEWDFPEIPPWVYWDFPDLPPLPPWILPDLPDWEIPDYPDMSFVGDFYYRKPYKKKDLDELRKKCIIYNKNSIEFALVLRHNMTVLKGFFNMMTDYLSADEFNDFTDLIPPQRLKELNLDPLKPTDFRDIINEFIRNTVDNNTSVNRNFNLIQEGLSDYETGSDDANFRNIVSNMKQLKQDNPDVERMKTLIDNLNYEVATNFNNIMHNLSVVRARLL